MAAELDHARFFAHDCRGKLGREKELDEGI